MPLIVVCGALANKAGNGGAAWTRLSWALGFERLPCDVYFIEQIGAAACRNVSGEPCDLDGSTNLAYFKQVTEEFGLAGRSALIQEGDRKSAGLRWTDLEQLADAADLLVNISGHLTLDPLKPRFRKRVFIDLDPGYTQFWHAAGLAVDHLRDHHFYFTVAENIGRSDCRIPTGDIAWRTTRQPVLLNEWAVVDRPPSPNASIPSAGPTRFTTVASWRGPYGRAVHNGVQFGLKAHEFRKFLALPTLSDHTFEIALDAHPADRPDVESLVTHHWRLTDPREVAAGPLTFRRYVQASDAEFSVAQGIYVETHSGWFSDRTVRYLASGKPALVQDTGFSRNYPVGCGLMPFRTLAEAARGADRISRDYAGHSRAARAIAETFFDSDKVLRSLLHVVEVTV